jgi:protein disulfide-isomerase
MKRFFAVMFLFFAVWLAIVLLNRPVVLVSPATPSPKPARVFAPAAKPGLNGEWIEDAKLARALATESGRPILYFFTGSDWCMWCRKMHEQALSKPAFSEWAARRVVLMKVDVKQHTKQPAPLKDQNATLMQELKTEGRFPMLVFVEPSGREAGRMGYFPGGPDLVLPAMEEAMAGLTPGGDTPAPAP